MDNEKESPEKPAGSGSGRNPGLIEDETLIRALGRRYLTYALSTIMHRALPDVRDGLKPVHRRLLYAMQQLKMPPDGPFKKSARVVGDVVGKYHPHGESSVYDALVRLAQDFSARYPLIDGQANFGNIDGDNPAAMRYTECRLTATAAVLLRGLDDDAVDFSPNYDGQETEPDVLPSAFPNLLANGSNGIAVGMATSIPPHNAGELCDALLHLLKSPGASIEKLMEFVPAPDFPTGGILIEPASSMLDAYRTGRGGFRLRSTWHKEELGRGRYEVIVTEIPFQVQKAKLVERIAALVTEKKLPILADVRDESAEDLRLVLEPRSGNVDAAVLMEALFRQTDLEVRIPLNLNVLDAKRTPRVMSLGEALQAFIDHRRDVLLRRSRHRIGKIDARAETLDGYIIAYLNLDRVIEIIREEDHPKPVMVAEFGLTDNQAEAILNMRLRSLRKLEEMELRKERDALAAERATLTALLDDETAQSKALSEEMRETKKKFGQKSPGGARRTEIAEAPKVEAPSIESMIDKEPITVICSENGWIRAMKGHVALDSEVKYKDGDGPRFMFHAQTTDRLLMMATNGRFYTIGADKLPGGRSMGEPVRLLVDLPNEEGMVALFAHRPGAKGIVATRAGRGFLLPEADALAQTRTGKQVLNTDPLAPAALYRRIGEGDDTVVAVGANRKLLAFPLEELPEMSRGKGVLLQRYKDGGLTDLTTLRWEDGLKWTMGGGNTRHVKPEELTQWRGKRAGAGLMAPRGFPQDNRFD